MKLLNKSYNTLWLSVLAFFFLLSCDRTTPEQIVVPSHSAIIGLASPIKLSPGKNIVYLADYFHHVADIESFTISTEEPLVLVQRQGDSLLIEAPLAGNKPFRVLSFSAKGETYQIPVFLSNKKEVQLSFEDPNHSHTSVSLKGEMNAWNANATVFSFTEGVWRTTLYLEPGNYQYKMLIDGVEADDPLNNEKVSNGLGGFNNVLRVENASAQAKPSLTSQNYGKNTLSCGLNGEAQVLAFWQNMLLETKLENGTLSVIWPEYAQNWDRSFVRIFAANETGFANDILVPLEKGAVLSNVAQLNRTDYHNLNLYNAFVDRFCNADTSNDFPTANDSILPQANNLGGDILGVISKVHQGYFKDLGVNGIWLSPVVKNVKGAYGYWPNPESKFSAYHGYWPISFTRIDKRFGTAVNLEELVDKAHSSNMNLFLDFVANHVHKEHPVYKAHKDWATNLHLKDGSLNTERWDDHRLSTWFDVFLPSLKLYEPQVYNMLSDSAVYWVKKYHIDGFRHDATKHVPHHFWRTLTQKLKTEVVDAQNHAVYQIGETYGSRPLVSSYVNSGELSAQFDFNLYDDAVAVFAGGEGIQRLAESLEKSLAAFGAHHLMGNISGNQDRARFVSYADGSVRFDENAKAAGWTRDIQLQDTALTFRKMALLMAFNFSVPGVPVIYYGDEIGMPGGNDPDNRRMMRFENLSKQEIDLRNTVAALAKMRSTQLALMYGSTRLQIINENTVLIERQYFNEKVIIVLNNCNSSVLIDNFSSKTAENLQANFGSKLSQNVLTVQPFSFEILTQIAK